MTALPVNPARCTRCGVPAVTLLVMEAVDPSRRARLYCQGCTRRQIDWCEAFKRDYAAYRLTPYTPADYGRPEGALL